MSFKNLLLSKNINNCLRNSTPLLLTSRQGHTIRGKPPGVAKTLDQRLQEENQQDAELLSRVNIGFPRLRPSRSEQLKERLQHLKAQRANAALEKEARSNKLLIDLNQVQREYRQSTGQYDLRLIADHYGIFKDLFELAYFVPRIPLDVKYEIDTETWSIVHHGNIIKPVEAAKQPEVSFDGSLDPITGKKSTGDTFWTLIATNPDGHLIPNGANECLHWFVANIPNGDVKKGDVLVNYLPPFPPRGIGYQRFVFVLYKQEGKLDLSEYKIDENVKVNLEKRHFKTLDFYRKHQENVTPAGLCFYQTDWDASLTDFYHKVLKLKEPIFEYDFPKSYLADQKWFPLRQPFNLYMDKHRDPKQVNKEYLERNLAKTDPFQGPEKPLRFPNAHPVRDQPSWLKTEIVKDRLRIGRINDY